MIRNFRIYDLTKFREVIDAGRQKAQEGGWESVIAEDAWRVEDTRREDMGH